jgi:hypothetical protein
MLHARILDATEVRQNYLAHLTLAAMFAGLAGFAFGMQRLPGTPHPWAWSAGFLAAQILALISTKHAVDQWKLLRELQGLGPSVAHEGWAKAPSSPNGVRTGFVVKPALRRFARVAVGIVRVIPRSFWWLHNQTFMGYLRARVFYIRVTRIALILVYGFFAAVLIVTIKHLGLRGWVDYAFATGAFLLIVAIILELGALFGFRIDNAGNSHGDARPATAQEAQGAATGAPNRDNLDGHHFRS